MNNIYTKFQPLEQERWRQSNIDTLFYAGEQTYVNNLFQSQSTQAFNNYYFNIVQQPVNMITGYQRQHRKSLTYVPVHGSDSKTTDQYTRLITTAANTEGIHEDFSKGCELAAISGMTLAQPYLNFNEKDQAQGDLRLKIWEYNSFMVDPFFRNADMSDARFVWCQEYIDKDAALERFPENEEVIRSMSGSAQRYGNFYFLPENYSLARNNLLVLSYIWYKSRKIRKRLYSESRKQFFDFPQDNDEVMKIVQAIPDLKVVEVKVPTWKQVVVLNDKKMYQGENELGFDCSPFVPIYWNYDPHISQSNLRVRSLIRPMRDPQFLFNHKVISNNDIAAATINSGWKRKIGAVANEDNLKKGGSGYDVIVNEGYEMTDVEKIIPNAVPQSDLELANQMYELMYNTSGINMENWSGQADKQISSLTMMLKQAANLLVFQKYFDQWDQSLKLIGNVMLQIVLNNWNAEKVSLLLNEEPTELFYNKIFAQYQVVVEEGILTPTQRNMQAQQLLDINNQFQREVFPPSMIIKDMNIQGKTEAMEYLQQQEESAQNKEQEQSMLSHAIEDAKLKEIYSKATSNIATARERHGRAESNIGLFEERLSEITRNRALATKDKMEALEKLVDVIAKYGEIETSIQLENVNRMDTAQEINEDREKEDAKRTSLANDFQNKIMGGLPQIPEPGNMNQSIDNQPMVG